MKYEGNFIKPKVSEEIPHHDSSEMEKIGANMVLLDDSLFSGAGVRITTRIVRGVVDEPEDYVELHTHEVDQVFIYLGEAGNESSLEVEFRFEEEVYRIKSPTTVFVPKGVAHTQKIIRGSGRYITLLKKGKYI
ncbi:MAG: hypothetical protein ACFFE8_11450 [Candidatus Heimdallarchaeota archaeon]